MSYEIDIEKRSIVQELSEEIGSYFDRKNYGVDIDSCFIAIICVSPKFDAISMIRPPKYLKVSKTYFDIEGKGTNFGKQIRFDIKLNFQSFLKSSNTECRKMIAKEILLSLVVFEQLKKKIKHFDTAKFRFDLELFFKDMSLI